MGFREGQGTLTELLGSRATVLNPGITTPLGGVTYHIACISDITSQFKTVEKVQLRSSNKVILWSVCVGVSLSEGGTECERMHFNF